MVQPAQEVAEALDARIVDGVFVGRAEAVELPKQSPGGMNLICPTIESHLGPLPGHTLFSRAVHRTGRQPN